MNLVGKGEYLKSPNKKYLETIVFVPFFFGKKKNLHRHAQFVNEIGFDCVVFNLTDNLEKKLSKTLFELGKNIPHGWGFKNLWAQEITHNLNEIPNNKIVFAFSSPSTAALKAIADRNCKDICGIVCDSGPFFNLLQGYWKYFTYAHPIKNLPVKIAMNALTRALWGMQHEKGLRDSFNRLPNGFPVLSIRGWKDPLVSLASIEKAFSGHEQIDLEILNLPQGGHLDGLKNFSEIYKPRVEEFLKNIATEI